MEAAILLRNYSRRTLEAYRFWIGKFQSFVRSRPTGELGPQEVRGFLTELAVRHGVASLRSDSRAAGYDCRRTGGYPLAKDHGVATVLLPWGPVPMGAIP